MTSELGLCSIESIYASSFREEINCQLTLANSALPDAMQATCKEVTHEICESSCVSEMECDRKF